MTSTSQHLLVIANETAAGHELHHAVRAFAADPDARVHVVAPALNSRVRSWFSDSDDAHAAAEDRLAECLAQLDALGIDADGHVGDEDPLQAIEDALVIFPAPLVRPPSPRAGGHGGDAIWRMGSRWLERHNCGFGF